MRNALGGARSRRGLLRTPEAAESAAHCARQDAGRRHPGGAKPSVRGGLQLSRPRSRRPAPLAETRPALAEKGNPRLPRCRSVAWGGRQVPGHLLGSYDLRCPICALRATVDGYFRKPGNLFLVPARTSTRIGRARRAQMPLSAIGLGACSHRASRRVTGTRKARAMLTRTASDGLAVPLSSRRTTGAPTPMC